MQPHVAIAHHEVYQKIPPERSLWPQPRRAFPVTMKLSKLSEAKRKIGLPEKTAIVISLDPRLVVESSALSPATPAMRGSIGGRESVYSADGEEATGCTSLILLFLLLSVPATLREARSHGDRRMFTRAARRTRILRELAARTTFLLSRVYQSLSAISTHDPELERSRIR